MAPGKTKKKHGYGSKKKKLKWKAGLDLKKRTKDVDQIHVSCGNRTRNLEHSARPPLAPAPQAAVTEVLTTGKTDMPIDYDLPGCDAAQWRVRGRRCTVPLLRAAGRGSTTACTVTGTL